MTNTIKIHDRIEPLVPEWEQLAHHCNASPFLWPRWIDAWWRAFGKRRLQIVGAYQNGRLAGILPVQQNRGALSSTANSETPLFGFLAANETAAEALAQALFSQKPRRIDLSLLLPNDAGVSATRKAAAAASYKLFTESKGGAPYIAIDETTWDACESGLGRNLRKDLRRRRRRLEEEGRLTLDIFDGTEGLADLLTEGLRIEGLAWKDDQGTSINARPATRRFYTEVAYWAAERGWLRLAFLQLDGRALAFDYCLEYDKIHYVLKTGYDPAFERFSPGKVLRHLMLARAFSEGLASYELLGFFAPWKQKWTDAYRELQFLHIFAPTGLGLLDQATFVGVSSVSRRTKRLVQSPIFPERGRRLLNQAHTEWHRKLDRKHTS